MVALLQQILTIGALLSGLLCVMWGWWTGHQVLAGVAVAMLATGPALVLAAEFVLLRLAHCDDPAPRATHAQLVRAWWGEVLASAMVFGWQQPFCSRTWPDQLPAAFDGQGPRGLLLVHGFFCNRGVWNPWLERLATQGTPMVAINLEPAFGSLDEYTEIIERAVRQLEEATGRPPVAVAHSMGGLALRRWWAEQEAPGRLHHVVTLGTPHHGTWLARFAMTRNSRQMCQLSDWLAVLTVRESLRNAGLVTCFYSHCDNIVFPASTATLAGANNRHLPGVAHLHMVNRPEPWDEVQRLLSDVT